MTANAQGRPALAGTLLDQVLARVGPGAVPEDLLTVAGRARVTLALTWFVTGRRKDAFHLLDEAECLSSGPGGRTVRALASIQRAGLQGRLGHWAAALSTMQGMSDVEESAGPRAAVAVAINSGLARQLLGDVDGSAADLERGERLAALHGFDDLTAAALHDRGRLEFVRGHLSHALDLMDRARTISGAHLSQSDLDRARVLLEAGLLDAAGAHLETGRRTAAEAKLVHEQGEFTLEFARLALLQGDYSRAREQAEEALEAFAAQQEPAWQVQAELLAIEAEIAAGDVSSALAERASALADGPAEAGGVLMTSRLLAAEADAASGALDRARDRLATVPTHGLSLPDQLQRHLVQVTIGAAGDEAGGVRRGLLAGAAALGREQGRRSGLDARTAMALHGRRLQQLDLDLAMESGSPSTIFDSCERWRALSHRLPPVTPVDDPELAAQLTALRQARTALREDLGDPVELRRQVTEAEQRIQRRAWSGSVVPRDPTDAPDADALPDLGAPWALSPAVELAAVRPRLSDWEDTAMVSFFVHRDRLRAITVHPSGERLSDLGPVAVAHGHVRALSAALRDLGRTRDPRLAALIRRSADRMVSVLGSLLAPALPSTARLVILPSRLLAALPWRALPQLHHCAVTVAPSATFWTTNREPVARRPGPLQISALAGPGLRHAVDEVEEVARAWPTGRTVVNREATGAATTAALERCSVVHAAAHGTHHEQNPLFSSLLLADGPLFAHELAGRRLAAQHLVLSACDVGRAVVRPGDEPLGLTAALLVGGVDSVVAAVAPVQDGSTADALAAYHRQLAAGADAAAALAAIAVDHPESRSFCVYGREWSAPPEQLDIPVALARM